MTINLKERDKIEILTLVDNYIDIAPGDSNHIIQRAIPLKGMELRNSILAEHGFSSIITVSGPEPPRSLLFDFGFSEHGAAFNADALAVDMSSVEVMALSHGHPDHTGGLQQLSDLVGKKGIKLVLHPSALKPCRFLKITDDFKIILPSLSPEKISAAGVELQETSTPLGLLGDGVCYLGKIPKKTKYEKGASDLIFVDDGVEKQDPIEDDTAIVAHVKGKGLVIISGCAHSGIINTINYAREITGIEKIHAVMGGFHLCGPGEDPAIEGTVRDFREIDPDYIVPTHCTGRKAVGMIEREFPEKFLLNMAGTRMTFAA